METFLYSGQCSKLPHGMKSFKDSEANRYIKLFLHAGIGSRHTIFNVSSYKAKGHFEVKQWLMVSHIREVPCAEMKLLGLNFVGSVWSLLTIRNYKAESMWHLLPVPLGFLLQIPGPPPLPSQTPYMRQERNIKNGFRENSSARADFPRPLRQWNNNHTMAAPTVQGEDVGPHCDGTQITEQEDSP